MSLTKENIGKLSLDEFVNKVIDIYSEKDAKRSIWDIWLHANHHAASIGEEARKYEPGRKLLMEIADFTMWLFTLISRIKGPVGSTVNKDGIAGSTIRTDKSFSELIWNKYPGMCPVCFWRRTNNGMDESEKDFILPCDCLVYPVETREQSDKKNLVIKLRKYSKQHRTDEIEKKSVDDWQKMFQGIFQANLRHLSLIDIAFHLLEEVGEVSDAMARMYTYSKKVEPGDPSWRQIWLENEIADVASWLFTLVNSLALMPKIAREFINYVLQSDDDVIKMPPITLSGIIWRRYGSDDFQILYCQACRQSPCKCDILLVSSIGRLGKLEEYTTDVLD